MAIGLSVSPALADDAQIIIRYGENVAERVREWAELISDEGVTVELQSGLDNPNCAAIIHDGQEKYRYDSQSLERATIAVVSIRLANGKRISSRGNSDCPIE